MTAAAPTPTFSIVIKNLEVNAMLDMVESGAQATSRLSKHLVLRAAGSSPPSISEHAAMILSLLMLFPAIQSTAPGCSPTVFYRNCWMRRFPGVLIDVPLSRSRGAHLVNDYHAKTAGQCSRTCCLHQNDTCNVAVFNCAQDQGSSNCFHLNCPTQESCIMRRKTDFMLFNVTKGEDPDLLIFGNRRSKGREPSSRSSTNISRFNHSEYLALDKQRHYNRYVSFPPQATRPNYSWYPSVSLPSQTLPSTLNSATSNDFQNTLSDANSKRANLTESPGTSAFIQSAIALSNTTQAIAQFSRSSANASDDASVQATATNILPLNQGNITTGSFGKNQTVDGTTAPAAWPLGPEVLLVPLLTLSLTMSTCMCTLLWVVARCRKRRGYYRTLQPGSTR